jgi:cob(I)alamin adenosyltransferase
MSKIYTKTGDTGLTSLIGGSRLSKDHQKIEAYGSVDELNAWIGVLADAPENAVRKLDLKEIQDRLFTIGSDLASEIDQTKKKLPDLFLKDITFLEQKIDAMQIVLPPLRAFVLPGGHAMVSFAHVARTVCRRAERQVIGLSKMEEVNSLVVKYLNRLSDYLFVVSRIITMEQNAPEISWKPRTSTE